MLATAKKFFHFSQTSAGVCGLRHWLSGNSTQRTDRGTYVGPEENVSVSDRDLVGMRQAMVGYLNGLG